MTVRGRVLIAGPFGLTPARKFPLDVYTCERRDVCLSMPGVALTSVVTNADGQFVFTIPIDLVRRRVLLVLEVFVGGVRCRLILTPRSLPAGAANSGGGSGIDDPELTVDPITEAATRLLEEAGLERYGDEGIDNVLEAVQAANADTDFAGLDAEEANEVAESTAATDPAVQEALEENILACTGDCNDNRQVTIDELVFAVSLSLNELPADSCAAIDMDHDGEVAVNELIAAVGSSLHGCP